MCGHFHVFSFLNVSESLFTCFRAFLAYLFSLLFFGWKNQIFLRMGVPPPPLGENFEKISNLIFEPFPKWLRFCVLQERYISEPNRSIFLNYTLIFVP